jgi:pimeloyl-ACP methyl ester carboxylesterase
MHQFAIRNRGNSRLEPVSGFVVAGATRLRYVSCGSGQPLVFVHGNPGSSEDWAELIRLSAGEHRAVAFDRPGHGQSERGGTEDPDVEAQAYLVECAIAALGLGRPILVAHSWGGALALACAVRHPDNWLGLVLLAPAAYESGEGALFWSDLATLPLIGEAGSFLFSRLIAPGLIKRELKRAFAPDPVPAEYLNAALANWTNPSRVRAFTSDDVTLDSSLRALSPHYSKMRVPVVIVTGDSDLIIPPAESAYRLYRELPVSELVVLKGAGHQIPFTHPGAVLEAVEKVREMARTG